MVAPPGGQFLGDPPFEGLAEPNLRDAGEVDDPAAAVAEHGGVPEVLALLVLRRRPRSQHRMLQVLGQHPVRSSRETWLKPTMVNTWMPSSRRQKTRSW